jgi:hypothetical protein
MPTPIGLTACPSQRSDLAPRAPGTRDDHISIYVDRSLIAAFILCLEAVEKFLSNNHCITVSLVRWHALDAQSIRLILPELARSMHNELLITAATK